jgi:hypothetical protein
MKIPLYKYKFKQIFKKIGQSKAFLCISSNFYFVAVLTWTVEVKNKHISVGLANYWTVGLTGCRIIATIPF